MNAIRPNPGQVQLSCGHYTIYDPPPFLGDQVYCYRCTGYAYVVTGGMEDPRRNTLECRDCHYKVTGKLTASLMTPAETHHLRTGHTVDIIRSGNTVIMTYSIVTEP